MKILQINSVCGIGSTGRIATDIHHLLIKQGHESWIAYGRGEARNCENTFKIGSKIDSYMHVAKTRVLDKHGFGSKQATIEFIEKVKELNPDVIHLHNIHGYYINIELLFNYLKEAEKKVVWTLHDCWAFTGHCSHFDYVGCEKWKNECFKCPQKKEYPSSFLLDGSKRNYVKKRELFSDNEFLKIVTPSTWLSKLVKESFLKDLPVKVINNGIDLSTFKPTESNFRMMKNLEDKFIVLGIARWDKRKGLEYFIELASKLDENYQVIVVGVTKEQKKILPNNIIAIANTNNSQELVEIYSAANVFVNSTLEDNFPTTNLEAQACGTPVITFDTGGSKETVNKSTGIIVEKGNFNDLFKAIEKLASEKKDTKIENVKWIKKYFNSSTRYDDYISFYNEL